MRITQDVQLAADGSGFLLQRDYWAVLRQCSLTPHEAIRVLKKRFCELSPEEFVRFSRSPDADELLNVDEVLTVKIRLSGEVGVRVVHADDNSVTLCTLKGHPEAGKITFGAYRTEQGDVIFHIRSRARSRSPLHFAGFITAGDAIQTNTWTDFIDRFAHTVGEGVIGKIQAVEREVDETDEDAATNTPTFIARGD